MTILDDLVKQIGALIGKGSRSQFIADAVALELRRRRLAAALEETDGSLADVDIPGWETRESAATWVRALRRAAPLPGFSIALGDCTS